MQTLSKLGRNGRQGKDMTYDKRSFNRYNLVSTVIIRHDMLGEISVRSKDISDGGVAVFIGSHLFPPKGTVVDVIIKKHTGPINNTPVKMQVMHIQPGGIAGLKFIS